MPECFEVCRNGTLCDPTQDASDYAKSLRGVLDLKDLHWFLSAAWRRRQPGCPVDESDFRHASRGPNPLRAASGLLNVLSWVLAPLNPTDRTRCIEEVCALLTACPVPGTHPPAEGLL